jgi:hypothetical protein
MQRIRLTCQQIMFRPKTQCSLVPEPSNNSTDRVRVGPTQTNTSQTAGVAGLGKTCRFQSLDLFFGFFYLWLHLDILLLITKYYLLHTVVLFG